MAIETEVEPKSERDRFDNLVKELKLNPVQAELLGEFIRDVEDKAYHAGIDTAQTYEP